MKRILFVISLNLMVLSVLNNTYAQEPVIQEVKAGDGDEDCNKRKFPDFKRNLRLSAISMEANVAQKVDSMAYVYFKEMQNELPENEKEIGFLDTLILASTAHYATDSGVELFSFGYIVHSDHSDFEPGEASFYLIGIKEKGKILFLDIMHDIEGALILQLLGFEYNSTRDTAIIWGKVEGLFLEEFGRFKLVVQEKMRLCLYECKDVGGVAVPNDGK